MAVSRFAGRAKARARFEEQRLRRCRSSQRTNATSASGQRHRRVRRRRHKQKVRLFFQPFQKKSYILFPRGDAFDKGIVHAVETVVIDWVHQTQDVLKKSSAQALLDGSNPMPFVELDFWEARQANVEYIFDQLQDGKVRKMAELLERTKSSYFPAFKKMFNDVRAGREKIKL